MNDSNNSGVNTIILVLIFGLIIFGLVWFFRGGMEDQNKEGLDVGLNIPTNQDSSDDGGSQ